MGDDPLTGKNFDHRRKWMEQRLKHFASLFGIDLLAFAILSNHFHLVLRSRPDVVKQWDVIGEWDGRSALAMKTKARGKLPVAVVFIRF